MSMDTSDLDNLQSSLTLTYNELTTQLIKFLPTLISAILILSLGILIAIILKLATKKLMSGLNSLFLKLAKTGGLKYDPSKNAYGDIVSKSVFWIVIAFFIASATNMLGLNMFSQWINSVINYLPNLITGLLIILGGFLISNVARQTVLSATLNAGIQQSEVFAIVTQTIIFFTILIVGIEQIGINVQFLKNVLMVIVSVLLAGGALAFSLGAKPLIANIIGAQYVRKHCRIGDQLKVNTISGILAEVTQTSLILETDQGRAIVPAHLFHIEPCYLSTDATLSRTEDHP